VEDVWSEYRDELTALRVAPVRRVTTLLWDARFSLMTALLAGFGRAAAEVGTVIIVGGNIDGFTRVMTTAIAGLVLITLIIVINALAWGVRRFGEVRAG
jgi:tungstate transport system permease protein